jgi:type II secretory pathway component PulC
MRNILKATALVAMLAITGSAFAAQTTPATAKKAASTKPAAVSNHTTSGTVKSASDTALVISKGGKDQTFVVNATTEKKGAVETGAHVSVHYTMSGKDMVATAITVAPAKPASKPKGK